MQQGMINKEDWVAMFRETGLDDTQMSRWHQVFERRHPEAHQAFLEHLGIAQEEIAQIRKDHA